MSRIQAAWRASTDTIVAALASVSGLRFAAWPLYAATTASSRAAAVRTKRCGSPATAATSAVNGGAVGAALPSACSRNVTCSRSCPPTMVTNSASSPVSAPVRATAA